jgi:hypothetical protein
MALLGHVSAKMSLRYGRLFDQTVRAELDAWLRRSQASQPKTRSMIKYSRRTVIMPQLTNRHQPQLKACVMRL